MNELAKVFNAMGIDTNDVIEAAASKWNFIKLKPGLVGGHCISVDPYYLIQKAQVHPVKSTSRVPRYAPVDLSGGIPVRSCKCHSSCGEIVLKYNGFAGHLCFGYA